MARKQRDSGRSTTGADTAKAELPKAEGLALDETTTPGHVPVMEEPVVAALPDPSVPPAAAAPPEVPDKDQELASLRSQLAEALKKADLQLGAATQKLLEAEDLRRRSMPPPPTEANEARVRAARLSAELAELRIERDDQKRLAEDRGAEAASLREQVATLQAALEVREARTSLSETQGAHAQRKLEESAAHALAVEGSLSEVRRELAEARGQAEELTARLQAAEDEAQRLLRHEEELTRQKADLEGQLDLGSRDTEGLRAELARAQTELEATQRQAQGREQQIVQEVRDREMHMVAEVQAREAQLVASAQGREAQLIAEAKAALEGAVHAQLQKAEQLARAQATIEQGREREAALDAELRLLRARSVEGDAQQSAQLDGLQHEVRSARLELDSLQERTGRAEAHAQELLSTVDSLGRERAALRAEAGSMRARVEALQVAETRIVQLQAEVEELRGENDFLNQEVARYASAPASRAPPPLPGKP